MIKVKKFYYFCIKYVFLSILCIASIKAWASACPPTADGQTCTNNGSINFTADDSTAINGGDFSSVTIINSSTGSASLIGNSSYGIQSNGTNSTISNYGSITTIGDYSAGIATYATGITINNFNTLSANGTDSYGIVSYADNVRITNTGSIFRTSNGGGAAISSNGNNSTIINSGTIESSAEGIMTWGSNSIVENSNSISTTGRSSYAIGLRSESSTINNSGLISTVGEYAHGIYSFTYAENAYINNMNSINTSGDYSDGIRSLMDGARITNTGSINTTGFQSNAIYSSGANSVIKNFGSIYTTNNNSAGISIHGDDTTITNTGSIRTFGDDAPPDISADGIASFSDRIYITNSGTIQNSGPNAHGIRSLGADATIVNTGTISASGPNSHGIYNAGTNAVVNNEGTITATATNTYGIYNVGSISSISNSQGGAAPLTYYGNLPTNYYVGINGASYGKLNATNVGSSQTIFGISTGSIVGARVYSGILTGVTASNLTGPTSGTIGGFAYRLALQSGTTDLWDLLVPTYTNAANTLSAVQQNASGLSTVINMQTAALQAGLSYDCKLYDENNLCVSMGGRYSYAGASPSGNAQAGLVIVGYRTSQTLRLGVYADQTAANATPSDITQKNNGPMFGIFGNWNLNKDGSGFGVKASVALSQSKLDITRSNTLAFTEAGEGTTQLGGQAYQLKTSYEKSITDKTNIIPYLGLMYTRLNIGGYSESANSNVNYPLSYNSMTQNNFAAIGGVGLTSLLLEKLTGTASVGIQQSLNYSMGNYQGTSQLPGLYNFSVQMPGYNNTGATATAGLYFDVKRNERLGFNVLWQQQPFIATNTTTALATYTIGF